MARPKATGWFKSLHHRRLDAANQPIEAQIRAPARCTTTPSTASPRTRPQRKPALRGYVGVGGRQLRPTGRRKAFFAPACSRWERDLSAGTQAGPGDFVTASTSSAADAVVELRPERRPSTRLSPPAHTISACRGARVDVRCAAQQTAAERADGRDHRCQVAGRRSTGSTPAGLPEEPAFAGQGARLVQRARATATIARGREAVEAAAARGQDGAQFDDLAQQLGCRNADALFEVVGKDGCRCAPSRTCCARPVAADARQ